MGSGVIGPSGYALAVLLALWAASSAHAQQLLPFIFPEERTIRVRDPSELPAARIPQTPPPQTVSNYAELPARELSLDETIRTALANSQVVRILAGATAVSSGRTVYDTAIVSSGVDQQHARFDPALSALNTFNRFEQPPVDRRTDDYNLNVDVSKTTTSGGTVNLGVNTNPSRTRGVLIPGQLNPSKPSSAELSFTQPLLQGGGFGANLAPIVLARIDTERSYFQFKDSVQELVRGTIDAYWALVFARTDLWARQQQYEQARFAYRLVSAQAEQGLADRADVALSKTAMNDFDSARIAAQANVLAREAALRNLLGFPPYDTHQLVPITPPLLDRLEFDWQQLLELAEQLRPDIIELKLILEADQQQLLLARNQAHPRVDAVALYRWNGLDGSIPNGPPFSTGGGRFTDWTLGVNFSVPLGLRAERAGLRRQELIVARDRANLDQGLHAAAHDVAANLRNLAQFYDQYRAFRATREAARENLEAQLAAYRARLVDFLNVFQAISSWGNSVSAEAGALLQYNVELANLERQSGTILEAHGIRFFEERFASLGPLGPLHHPANYPQDITPTPNLDRYQEGDQPAENTFDLTPPEYLHRKLEQRLEQLPAPQPGPPQPPRPAPLPNPNDAAQTPPALRWLD